MTDTEELPQTNGISDLDEEERARMRPADIDADVREMERRKRVEVIMNSKLFREELERIIETQLKEGSGTSALMQQISDMMGVTKQQGNVFKSSSCVIPINDIRGIESMGYAKGEKILRCKLAAVYRLIDLYGWSISPNTLVTVRLNQNDEHFLVNPYGMLFHEMTASSLIKVDMQGNVVEQGTTNFCVNIASFSLHAAVHAARPDIKCIIHVHTPAVVAVSALKQGLLPISKESVVVGDISIHGYLGGLLDHEEKDKLARNLGPNNKVLVLTNQGALCCGETIEEAFFNARNTVLASETQLKLIPVGIENLNVLSDEARKRIYEAAHKAPASSPRPDQPSILEAKVERKWRVGGVEFEGLMRMLDNAGFRTGYIYRHPLVKGDPPRPRNDVEVPPAVSSLGYLLEEEELYKQGLWKKLEGGRKGHDRSRWLNSPNVYQKVEILETGTTDPKKITKWVAEASPAHSSTPVKIDDALQFVPKNTNPKEFKQKQQQIKDYRRADKISAGPQSHILEGVSWEEARKMQDAAVTQTGDQVVLMGAASKGIIQRGHQHNATVYKSPYAKNPFDSVTDEELDEYKKVVEKKAKGEYDTDFSESELSSAAVNKRMDSFRSPSETEEESRDEHQVLRIETKQAPRPSQPEVVLSDGSLTESFLQAERASDISNRSDNMVEEKIGYRTNSHYGLPKGSFMNPNPVHFHIARVCQVALPDKPNVISAGSFKLGVIYKPKINRKENRLITIKIGDIDFVEYKVPLDTLRDIVTPLAQFLETFPKQVENQFSQTSYVKRSASTQIEIGENSEDGTKQKRSSSYDYERKILEELREALFTDCYFDDNVSIDSKWVESTHEHDENDSLFTNESLIEISSVDEQLLESLLDCDCEKRSNESLEMSKRKILFSVLPFKDCELKSSDYLCSLTSNFSDFKKVILDAKNILNRIPGDVIPDAKCSATISSNEDDENGPLENDIIIDETIDENDMKNNSFDNFSIYMLNKEEQSTPELKIQQEHQKVEKTFTQCDIFTQKTDDETLSPTGRKSQKVSKINKDAKEIIVTSFKKHESPNSKGETFWMSINTAEGLKKQDQQGHLRINQVRNVDEIPLRPPPELLLQPQKRQLKQFKFREGLLETSCRQKSRNDTKPESESEDSDKENQNFMYEKQENDGCDDIPNEAAEKPEVNVLLFNSVTFNRTKTVNFTSYEVSKSVTIERNSDHSPTLSTEEESFMTAQSTQNDGDEDWMGFPGAKF